MKLLQIIASADKEGGGPIDGILRQHEIWAGANLVQSHELATLDCFQSVAAPSLPIMAHHLGSVGAHSHIKPLRKWKYAPQYIPWLEANADQYDAIIINGLWNYASFGAAYALRKSRTPYFVFTHGMMDPWFRKRYPIKHLAKQVFWTAGESRLLSNAKSVFFTCEEEMKQASGQFLGGSYQSTIVGYGAAPPPPRTERLLKSFRNSIPALKDRRYLLYFSRIHPKKGVDLLVDAFASCCATLGNTDLVVVGPDSTTWSPELKRRANELGVGSRIHWPGPLYGDEKWGALYGADAFILPSHQENFGIAVAEALGCATPVLISDKVNIWREIERAGAGFVKPDTLSGTIDLLRQWSNITPEQKVRMSDSARSLFRSSFDVSKTAPKLLMTIGEMIR